MRGGLIEFTARDATDYSFRVRTRSSVGAEVRTSVPSSALGARTPGPPCAPTLSAGGGNLQASLSWIADASCENGKTIVQFEIESRPSGIRKTYDGSVRSDVLGVPSHGIWELRIRAMNFEWGGWSSWQSATVYTTPCAPNVSASGGVRSIQVSVSHSPGECENLSDITEYQVDVTGTSRSVSPVGDSADVIFNSLDAGSYSVRARARNKAGWSSWSLTRSVGVIDIPCTPIVHGSGGTGVVSASWSACNNNSPITSWEVSVSGVGTSRTAQRDGSWQGLSAGTYTISVRAVNQAGWSRWASDTVTVTSARSVTLTYLQGETGLPGCRYTCHRLSAALSGFGRNRYFVECRSANGGLLGRHSVDFTSGLSKTLPCWYGPSLWGDIWVIIDGIESNRIRIP